ncbi:MAG: DUF1080 domain-containing protein, partial [Arcicella sp.]|nr:DUF1080 domain-containing protein [Arcicella sp.]
MNPQKILLIFLIISSLENIIAQTKPKPKSLFNGKDFTGWHIDVPAMDGKPEVKSPFIIRNGMLVSLAKPEGHIITDAVYENYQLEVQYRFAGKPG